MAGIGIVPMSFREGAKAGCFMLTAILPAIGLAISSPGYADARMSGAEKLYRLNAMLAVMGQSCGSTPDNFAADYMSFTDSHSAELTRTEAEFRIELTARYGIRGASRVLDRVDRSVANSYANGHPWLDCAQLKLATRNLSEVIGRKTLEEAADQLIGNSRPSRFADAHP